jgi:enoyl-CoA hydratase
MSDDDLVVVTTAGRPDIIVLTLNRPDKKNALSIALRDAVSDALDRLADDEEVKVVILTGAGDTFTAGFDLGEFSVDEPGFQELWASSDRYHHTVLAFPLPTIAAVNGAALAGGFDLAVLCDLRVAAASARFAHPEHAFAEVVYGPLHDLVGGAVARDLCLTGRSIDAEEALRLGVVSEVVPDGEVLEAAGRLAVMIAAAPRANLIRTKAKAIARSRLDPGAATLDL